mmetsp:Transcript_10887/g.26655  ORF Transcript_10887/g.26655 Transcript_10887/m.26655 type:complete len:399 (+) Transcript_10887:493-1689(+)
MCTVSVKALMKYMIGITKTVSSVSTRAATKMRMIWQMMSTTLQVTVTLGHTEVPFPMCIVTSLTIVRTPKATMMQVLTMSCVLVVKSSRRTGWPCSSAVSGCSSPVYSLPAPTIRIPNSSVHSTTNAVPPPHVRVFSSSSPSACPRLSALLRLWSFPACPPASGSGYTSSRVVGASGTRSCRPAVAKMRSASSGVSDWAGGRAAGGLGGMVPPTEGSLRVGSLAHARLLSRRDASFRTEGCLRSDGSDASSPPAVPRERADSWRRRERLEASLSPPFLYSSLRGISFSPALGEAARDDALSLRCLFNVPHARPPSSLAPGGHREGSGCVGGLQPRNRVAARQPSEVESRKNRKRRRGAVPPTQPHPWKAVAPFLSRPPTKQTPCLSLSTPTSASQPTR